MPPETTLSFRIIASPKGKKVHPLGLGWKEFTVAPRTGKYIKFADEDGKANLYKVKAVIHPGQPASSAGDLFVEHLGLTVDVLKHLHA